MQFCLINKIEILIKINKLNNIRTSHLSFHITFIVNKYGAFLVSVLETVVSEASLCWRLFGSQCHNLYLNKYEALSCSCVLETLFVSKTSLCWPVFDSQSIIFVWEPIWIHCSYSFRKLDA